MRFLPNRRQAWISAARRVCWLRREKLPDRPAGNMNSLGHNFRRSRAMESGAVLGPSGGFHKAPAECGGFRVSIAPQTSRIRIWADDERGAGHASRSRPAKSSRFPIRRSDATARDRQIAACWSRRGDLTVAPELPVWAVGREAQPCGRRVCDFVFSAGLNWRQP